MGKTAVFVLTTLQQLDSSLLLEKNPPVVLVLAHTRELAFQISKEYERFGKHMKGLKTAVFYGGQPIRVNK